MLCRKNATFKMDLNGWKKNILLTIIFVVYLILGAAIFYGIENDVPPPPPDAKTMYIMKTMSEKQMEGIQKGMSMAVPQVATMYKGQSGKETFDEGDVSKIAEMALTKVMKMVKVQMAQALGGKKGAPQASRHTAPNGNPETVPENSVESNPSYQSVPENKEENVVTEDKTMTEDMDNGETRRKRQAENETETMTTPAPTTTTTPEEQNKTPERPKPGYSSFIYLVLTGVTTIGYGNVCPHTVGGQLFFMVYITLGIPLFFFVIYKIAMAKRAATIAIHTKILQVLKKEALSTRVMNLTRLLLIFVPGFIVLMLVCPAIFSHFEDWSYIQSMYFVFSTITTIGFGDFYPGMMMGIGDPMEISSAVRGIYMVFVFLYMFGGISWVFGLGLMTFDCCCKRHQTKEITQKNGISTPPKITVVNEVEKNEVDLEKTEQPLLDETTKEVEMEEIKKEENNGENENA